MSLSKICLNDENILALKNIFNHGRGFQRSNQAPEPHTVLVLNIPKEEFPYKSRRFGDLYERASTASDNSDCFAKLVTVMSLVATCPTEGHGKCIDNTGDRRGFISDWNTGYFTLNGSSHLRSEMYLEDLLDSDGETVSHRLWLFLVDPKLKFNETVREIINTNQKIRRESRRHKVADNIKQAMRRADSDPYICHSNIIGVTDFYDLLASYLSGCDSESQLVQQCRQKLIEVRVSGDSEDSIQGEDHKIDASNPAYMLSPEVAFELAPLEVCDSQRDVWQYFRRPMYEEVREMGLVDQDIDQEDDLENQEEHQENIEELMLDEELDQLGEREIIEECEDTGHGAGANEASVLNRAKYFSQYPRRAATINIPMRLAGAYITNTPSIGLISNSVDVYRKLDRWNDKGIRTYLDVDESIFDNDARQDDANARNEAMLSLYYKYVNHIDAPTFLWDENDFDIDPTTIEDTSREDFPRWMSLLRILARGKKLKDMQSKVNSAKLNIYTNLINAVLAVRYTDRDDVERINGTDTDVQGSSFTSTGAILPETLTEEDVTESEVHKFSETNDLLKLRIKHNDTLYELRQQYGLKESESYKSREFEQALTDFRKTAVRDTWEVLMSSNNLPESYMKQRDLWTSIPISARWPDHPFSVENLSVGSTLFVLYLERFNKIHRGATTQTVFLILTMVAINAFRYNFGPMRPHALLVGGGNAGKSFAMSAVKSYVMGSLAMTHVTDKAFTTKNGPNKINNNPVFFHEMPHDYIGVDPKRPHVSGPTNPIIKDFLTRCRIDTTAYYNGDDPDRRDRLTQNIQSMVMTNFTGATNDVIPDQEEALMQRFLVIPVNYSYRKGFKRGDQSSTTTLEDDPSESSKHKLMGQIYTFLCMATEAMVTTLAIPEPNIDGAKYIVRGVLDEYGRQTGENVDHARKREKLISLVRTCTVMEAVHVVLCSPLAWKHAYQTSEDGESESLRDFDPDLFLEVSKRAYSTADTSVFCLTALSFQWENRNTATILQSIINRMNHAPQHEGKILDKNKVRFRMVDKDDDTPEMVRPRWGKKKNYHSSSSSSTQQGTGNRAADNIAAMYGSMAPGGQRLNNRVIDTNYVSIYASSRDQLNTNIVSYADGKNKPSKNEVHRLITLMTNSRQVLYASTIVPKETYRNHRDKFREFRKDNRKNTEEDENESEDSCSEEDGSVELDVDSDSDEENDVEEANRSTNDEENNNAHSDSESPLAEFNFPRSRRQESGSAMSSLRQEQHGDEEERSESEHPVSEDEPSDAQHSELQQNFCEQTEADIAEIYDKKQFVWVCDRSTVVSKQAPVAMISHGIRGGKRLVILHVMIQALTEENLQGTIANAITNFLSKDNVYPHPTSQDKNSWTYLTCSDYVYHDRNGHMETMPQYRKTITVKKTNKKMIIDKLQTGTSASGSVLANGISRNAIRRHAKRGANGSCADDIELNSAFDSQAAKIHIDVPLNKFFAQIHWINSGISNLDNIWQYTPEGEAEAMYNLIEGLGTTAKNQMSLIKTYPDDCVTTELKTRRINKYTNQEAYEEVLKKNGLMVSSNEMIQIRRIRAKISSLSGCYIGKANGKLKVMAKPNVSDHIKAAVKRINDDENLGDASSEASRASELDVVTDDSMEKILRRANMNQASQNSRVVEPNYNRSIWDRLVDTLSNQVNEDRRQRKRKRKQRRRSRQNNKRRRLGNPS